MGTLVSCEAVRWTRRPDRSKWRITWLYPSLPTSSARPLSRRPPERAELREKIKSGKVALEDVLDSDDPNPSRMKVSTLIESLPGYGKAKASKIMDELGISATRRVKGLGARQREQLVEALSK